MRALPFDSVDELMGSLEDLSMNQTRATASVRFASGMTTRSKGYQQSFTSKQYGGIMTVPADPFEDEAEELSRVSAIFREKGGFGRNSKDPPFWVLFDTREHRDSARRSYGPHCLNGGEDNHFARECPSNFINRSGLIHPAVGEDTPDEAEKRWRRWQKRLCHWARTRTERNGSNT